MEADAFLWLLLRVLSSYLFFNYWLKTFHPLAILIVPIIKGGDAHALPLLKAAQKIVQEIRVSG